MTQISRRTSLRATAALTALSLSAPWRSWAQAPGAADAPASAASAGSAGARPDPRHSGPDGALLANRLKFQGVALASMRIRDGATTFSAATVQGALPDEQTLFELGSITKTFTALLLADAVTRGLIQLDDPVEAVLPDRLRLRDSEDQPIRWVDLATHRSGLPRLPANLDLQATPKNPYASYDWPQMAAFLGSWKPSKPRNTAFEYSNLGVGLLGQSLGFLQKKDYATLLRERILEPLGLTNDMFLAPPAGRRFLDGHDRDGRPVEHWTFRPAIAPAGALLGTTRGLARFAQAAMGQFDHPLKDAFKLCLRKHGERDQPGSGIGLAWVGAPLPGRIAFNHDGATFGFSTTLWLDPTHGRAAAVLSNAAIGVADLGLHLLEPMIPPSDLSLTEQPSITLPPESLKPLVGHYVLSPAMTLEVRIQEGRLFARATGQQPFELFAKGPREFFAKVTPLEIRFDPSPADDAPAPALTIKQGGRNTRGTRKP